MKHKFLLLSALSLAMLANIQAQEQTLQMDFSEAPAKIECQRYKRAKKSEDVDFTIKVPDSAGRSFIFQCQLSIPHFRAYSGVAVGVGEAGKKARRARVRLSRGNGNKTLCLFSHGFNYKELAKPAIGFSGRDFQIFMQFDADSNSFGYKVTDKDKKVISEGSNIAFKGMKFSFNQIIISVVDDADEGAAYVNYDAEKQNLSGVSFCTESYQSKFTIDNIMIIYDPEK